MSEDARRPRPHRRLLPFRLPQPLCHVTTLTTHYAARRLRLRFIDRPQHDCLKKADVLCHSWGGEMLVPEFSDPDWTLPPRRIGECVHPDSFSRWERTIRCSVCASLVTRGNVADPASISAKLYSGKRNTHFSMLTVRTDSTTSPARGARQIWVSLGRLARKCSPQTRKEPPCKRRASKCGPRSRQNQNGTS